MCACLNTDYTMLDELFLFHQDVMRSVDLSCKRYLYDQINWSARAICLFGARGVGKTTMLCQYFLEHCKTADKGLYISADNIHVASLGLLTIASEFFSMGGDVLLIDEIHKYPNWSVEVKNIIDTFRNGQVIFSGSSVLELKKSKGDLSRRVVYKELPGLSFREYLHFTGTLEAKPFTLEEVLKNHMTLANKFKNIPVLKHFRAYLEKGYYPFFLDNADDYLLLLNNVIEKIITEDILTAKNIRASSITHLKKLLWLVATSKSFVPNIDKISKQLGITRETVYDGFDYLQQGGLLSNLYPCATGLKLIRKPGKIFMNNTNLLNAVNGSLHFQTDAGSVRETFFANQLSILHQVNLHGTADFILNDNVIIEVGGKSKKATQIKDQKNAYLAIDGIPIGHSKRIPLYLFGCLY